MKVTENEQKKKTEGGQAERGEIERQSMEAKCGSASDNKSK